MNFGSVCSGIEAASVAFNPLGWKAQFFSEIEPFPCAVLKHHYPTMPNLGDMNNYKAWPDATLDVLCGGTPCQSYSNAGLRAGLDDPRGQLMLTFGAVAERYRPRWLLWENVPGVLSSNEGRDFGAFLGLLGFLGYGFAYRVLDAQYFGLAQRRKRVFVVAYLGDWRRAAAVLFEREGLQGHPAPRRGEGQDAPAGTLRSSDGGSDVDHARAGHLIEQPFEVGNCLTARMHKGINTTVDEGQTPVLAFDPTQITNKDNRSNPQPGDPCHTLAKGMHAPAIVFGTKQAAQDSGEIAPTMTAMGSSSNRPNGGGQIGVAQGMQVRRLTPRECERLQGFPDDYTLILRKGKPAADGPRYKALGNSWTVPAVAWIGRRIQAIDQIERKI